MKRTTWLIIALSYLAFAEVLSWTPVPDLSLCLIEPSHNEQPANHDDKKYCPAFHVGAALAFEKVDSFLEHHDKSVVGGFTIVLAISTIGLWLATNKLWAAGERQIRVAEISAGAAKESADVANKTLIETQRAWVKILEVKVGPLVYDDQGARIIVMAKLKNSGNVPATNVVLAAFVYLTGKQINVVGEQETFCEGVRKWKGQSGPALFPSDVIDVSNNIPIPKADIEAFGVEVPGKSEKVILPVIIGCIDYTLPLNGSHRQTRFALTLSEEVNGENYAIYPHRGDIPADSLILTRWIGGGYSAD